MNKSSVDRCGVHGTRLAARVAALAAAALCGVATAGPPPPTPTPSLSDPNPAAVVRPDVARRFFRLGDTRRVDAAIIGDSNVRNALVSGHEDGMLRALSERFGCYATRVDPAAGLGGWAGLLTGDSPTQGVPFRFADFPRPLSSFAFPNGAFPVSGAYLPARVSADIFYNHGLSLTGEHPVGFENRLVYHLTQHTFRAPTTGEINISVRESWPGDGSHNYAHRSGISTASSSPGLADVTVDVPAGERAATGMLFCLTDFANGRGAQGPFFGLWQRVENPGRSTGIAFSPLLYQGGRSARAACEELVNLGPGAPALREWLRQITRLQRPNQSDGVLLVQIIHGGNDGLDGAPSLGPIGGLPSHTAEGYKDNLQGIINTLREAWRLAGYEPENLYFELGPYHPRAERLESNRTAERVAAELCEENPNTFAVRGTMLSTEAEFVANGWYTNATDLAHLSPAGFRAWGVGSVRAIQRAICPADLNDDRAYSVQDLFVFIAQWFGLTGRGDFNRDGAYELSDVFAFLEAYFAGCG